MPKSLPLNKKLISKEDLIEQVMRWQGRGERVVFTNGCFDILHPGHVAYLNEAKELGDRLVLALNTDRSVKKLNKGPERPLNDELSRAYVLAGLEAIDALCLFDEDTPIDLICALKPDVLVKGGDYNPQEANPQSKAYIVGSTEVRNWGGQVLCLDFVEGYSTTRLVEKIKRFG
ncbi:MAG: D-glycero-beta-D-manno-heptose 1-phosphate adenylyltransferase [Luteibaculum sp.]